MAVRDPDNELDGCNEYDNGAKYPDKRSTSAGCGAILRRHPRELREVVLAGVAGARGPSSFNSDCVCRIVARRWLHNDLAERDGRTRVAGAVECFIGNALVARRANAVATSQHGRAPVDPGRQQCANPSDGPDVGTHAEAFQESQTERPRHAQPDCHEGGPRR